MVRSLSPHEIERSDELVVEPLPGNFGLQIEQLDFDQLTDHHLRGILQLLYSNRFLVLKTGGISRAQFVSFARRIGEPITLSNDPEHPEIAVISNSGVDTTKSARGAAHWHTDQSFRSTVSSITMLYSVSAPRTGGETKFCDMAAAYESLPPETKDLIDNLIVEHRHGVSVSAPSGDHVPIPPRDWNQRSTAFHPLVRKHPETGQKTLYAVTGTSQGIRGMDPTKAKSLLKQLCSHALQPQFVSQYAHQPQDLVMWDNPTTMHSATPIGEGTSPDDTRVLHRISLKGSPGVLRN